MNKTRYFMALASLAGLALVAVGAKALAAEEPTHRISCNASQTGYYFLASAESGASCGVGTAEVKSDLVVIGKQSNKDVTANGMTATGCFTSSTVKSAYPNTWNWVLRYSQHLRIDSSGPSRGPLESWWENDAGADTPPSAGSHFSTFQATNGNTCVWNGHTFCKAAGCMD